MLLSVYFEETAYYHMQERKRMEARTSDSSLSSGEDWHAELVLGDGDDDD